MARKARSGNATRQGLYPTILTKEVQIHPPPSGRWGGSSRLDTFYSFSNRANCTFSFLRVPVANSTVTARPSMSMISPIYCTVDYIDSLMLQ